MVRSPRPPAKGGYTFLIELVSDIKPILHLISAKRPLNLTTWKRHLAPWSRESCSACCLLTRWPGCSRCRIHSCYHFPQSRISLARAKPWAAWENTLKWCLIDLGPVQDIVHHTNHHNINQRHRGCPHVWLKLQGISFAESILITLKYRFAVAEKTDLFQSLIFPTEGNFCQASQETALGSLHQLHWLHQAYRASPLLTPTKTRVSVVCKRSVSIQEWWH